MSRAATAPRAPRLLRIPHFTLECGETLTDAVQAYHLDGTPEPDGRNVVLVLHALTGSADAASPERGWWRGVVGPGRAIDTRRWAVLAPNLLGSCYGTTLGAASGTAHAAFADPAVRVTTRDQARFAAALVEALGIPLDTGALPLVVGGSLGGMVALEWAAAFPRSARAVCAIAAPAAHPAWGIAWNHLQRRAFALAGPQRAREALALARQIAMLSYRTPGELDARFGRDTGADGEWIAARWLERHGERLIARFDPHAYRRLLDTMDTHDVARGRAHGVAGALGAFAGLLVGVGIPGDVLYDAGTVRAWTDAANARYHELRAVAGHDGFLIEHAQVGALLSGLLAEVSEPNAPRPRGHAFAAATPPDACPDAREAACEC